ncbi:hypothetical protein [Rhodococcus sp. OK302]|uniref:hypothetical protein n=1 Tax=Rhodococcus sp. OK302 TaxID=1882769 RepID=UPI000B93B8F2|nr:hypothetical protein [Rhodococcus sp. OK302]OYD66822.1 hypothetical protein BDB13_0319 [Rhodococcus sp. OK302]
MNTVTSTMEMIEAVRASSELFGCPTADFDTQRAARRRFHRMAAEVHPDRVDPAYEVRATAATARLNELFRTWKAEADTQELTYRGDSGTYTLGSHCGRGSIADLYRTAGTQQVVVKIPRSPRANPLMEAERAALTDIASSAQGEGGWISAYFPQFVDRITQSDPVTGEVRQINVLNDLSTGFITLADVHRAYPDGLDPRDWAWMHRRLLRALAAAHQAGWVHTAVTADNVLIHPVLHGVVLVGWSFATRPGDRPAAKISSHLDSYPPELEESVSPAWDVYMAHQLMSTMLGDRIPSRMKAFALGCMQPNPRLRPDAVDLLGEFDELLDLLYGERTFRAFTVPSTKG